MAKIWARTRRLKHADMDVPFSDTIANAVFGFEMLGADIVPYHNVAEILPWVTRDDTVLDGVPQVRGVFRKFGIQPDLPDYPTVLEGYLGRSIRRDTLTNFIASETWNKEPCFIKPVSNKTFSGKIICNAADLADCLSVDSDGEILVSSRIDIKAEWRCFILYDRIVDIRPYGWCLDAGSDSWRWHFDPDTVGAMLRDFCMWVDRPAACAVDICVTSDRRTLLVECSDACSLGVYGLTGTLHAKLISARWSQLMDREDTYRFET